MTAVHEVGRVAGRVDGNRLWRMHLELAKFGGTDRGGVNRQALSTEEIAARGQILCWAREIGLQPAVDAIGNLFLRLEGRDPTAAAILTGSHIDTQPTGGKFDGAFGVLAGIEAVRALRASGVTPWRSIEVVAWMNEEGSRFAPGMMGSDAFAGVRTLEQILPIRDRDGIAVADALAEVLSAYPDLPRRPVGFPVAAFIEAHIEQGPILEAEAKSIGVVTGIQGSRRFRVTVQGEDAHAGTTPRSVRKDALLAAVSMVGRLDEVFRDPADIVKFTVGLFTVAPNAPSVVPSRVHFSVDVRHPDNETLDRLGNLVQPMCEAHKGPCAVEIKEIARARSIEFPQAVRDRIRAVSASLGIPHMDIYSAAGHDARQLHYICPTGMIFVPCKDGISHNEQESALPDDLVAGTQVLAEVLADLAGQP